MHRIRIALRIGFGAAVLASAAVLTAPAAFGTRDASTAAAKKAQTAEPGDIANGFKIFHQYFCYACHRFKAAGPDSHGIVGVNFDKKRVPYQQARAAVINGLPAALPLYPTQMVGYRNVLTDKQVNDVAAFVAKYSGTRRACEECPTEE